MVVRQEQDGTLRRYCHVGTGNYNGKTARLYEDFGLLTSDPQVGEDVAKLFNQLSGFAPRSRFKRLLVAPRSVRSGLIERIDAEIAHAKAGKKGLVQFKVNSIVDEQLIDALYRASQAGVHVDLWVRGICALRPGVEGLSENITVHSILGRFLEHSRVFHFGGGGKPEVFIGSADMMHRNLDRRVEALVSVSDPRHLQQLTGLLAKGASGDYAHWDLGPDGRWVRVSTAEDGTPLPDLQSTLIEEHTKRRRKARRR
jgi:polyphosphate kinase